MYYNTQKINLRSKLEVKRVETFLKGFDLKYEDVDYTLIIEEDGEIIATCSKKNNIVKCFAVSQEHQGQGISNILITDITNRLFEEGIYHNFIFTKPSNNFLFEGLGYKVIVDTDKVSLLETGNKNITSELKKLKKDYNLNDNENYVALIMNCNPFTLGHKYIVEKAAKENKNVIIFVVEEDKSSFPFKVRFKLIKEGVNEFENVTVIPGGNYIISSATFPNYFLRKDDDILKEYTKIDGNVFGKYFCKELNINKRYVGSEPYCNVTNTYNETLKKVLPKYGVEVQVVERCEIDNRAISASRVRDLLKEDKMEEVKELVPQTTYEFLKSEPGKEIIERLKGTNLPH
ncbi:MAG: [citrate (pro-3S)-lyase] ligase [Clostridium sp.]